MADALHFFVVDSTGAPLTGAAAAMNAAAQARDVTGATRTPPTVVELGLGEYEVRPSAADETAGTVVLIDTGAGNMPRHICLEAYKADRTNQFWSLCVENPDGSVWTGAAPTVGLYSSSAGARTPPTLVAVAGAYLFVAVPTAADVTADTAIRVTGPTGSAQPYWDDSTRPIVSSAPNVPLSPGVAPEALFVQAVREYLLRYLPAKVTQLNGLRAAVVKSALAEPFTIPSGAVLQLSAASQEATPTAVPLTAGVRTSAQVVADITAAAVPGLAASADEVGRVVLTSTTTPTAGNSVVIVARDVGPTGSNTALGWGEGGEHFETAPLVAPSWRGVVDGRPLTAPDMGQGFWVMLGNRSVKPSRPGIRHDMWTVTQQVELWRPFSTNAPPHRTREAISSCVRAVRELLLTTDGRYLGRQGAGDIQLADVGDASISGDPIRLNEVPSVLFDIARLTLTCRVFQRPE